MALIADLRARLHAAEERIKTQSDWLALQSADIRALKERQAALREPGQHSGHSDTCVVCNPRVDETEKPRHVAATGTPGKDMDWHLEPEELDP